MRRALIPVLILAALVLGVVNASGHSVASTTITVDVLGVGQVSSSPSGIKCGNGNTKCFITFSGSGTVDLNASPKNGWSDDSWGLGSADTDCSGSTSTTCTIPLDGSEHRVTASFTKSSGVTQSTLTVTYDNSNGDGDVTAPERTPPGTDIYCGSSGTVCSQTVLTGSTLTLFQTPDSGTDVFAGWGGACNGTSDSCTVEMDGNQHVSAAWGVANGTTQLTVSLSGGGSVKGGGINCPNACSATEALNAGVTLEADPDDGYVFSTWGGDCAGSGPVCTLTMSSDMSVTATFTVAATLTVNVVGNGNVSGGSGAINCGSGANVCSTNFAVNASVTLVASPATGSTFLGWTGACGGTSGTCTVSMTQSKEVTATFSGTTPPAPTGFTLTVSVSGNGTVTGSGINCGGGATTCSSSGHASGTSISLTATPSSGATFAGWGGACSGTSTTCTVTFDASKSVTASFTGGTSTFPLTVSVSGPGRVTGGGISCGNGATTCSANLSAGTTVVLTQTPATGGTFAGWGGSCTGTGTCTVSMTAARSVSATFTGGGTPGTLTINVAGRGTVSTTAGTCTGLGTLKTCVQHFKAGSSVKLTAHPGPGQTFLGWLGDCSSSGKAVTCSLTLSVARSVTANFSNTGPSGAALTALGRPIVRHTTTGFRVTLRFHTSLGGTARVRGLRAGRAVTAVSAKVSAGNVRVGPFPVALSGLYTFEIRLAGALLKMRTCLGACGANAPPPRFVLTRRPPTVTRSGDAWSVTLHVVANQIYDGRIRALRGTHLQVNQHFLGQAGRTAFGPFLLGPGNYTIRLVGIDAYGRTKTLTWVVALA